MTKTKYAGFVVTAWVGDGLMGLGFGKNYPIDNVLWHNPPSTLFKTRHAAYNAIRRSKKYAMKNGHPWKLEKSKVVGVVKE